LALRRAPFFALPPASRGPSHPPSEREAQHSERMQAADLELVRTVVQSLEAFPSDARKAFLEGLPASAAGTGGILLAAALEDARAVAEKSCEEATAAAEAADKELDVVKAAVSEANAAVDAKSGEALAAESAGKVAAQEAKQIEKEHKSTEKTTKGEIDKWAATREERTRAEGVLQEARRWQDADEGAADASVEAVQDYLHEIEAEKVLVAALPGAAAAKPETRKPFDKMVLEAAESALAKRLEEVDTAVKEAEPAEREAKAELLGLWALSQVTAEAAAEADKKASELNAAWVAAEGQLKLCKKRLAEVEAVGAETSAKKARAEARRAQLADGKAAVERLKAAPAEAPAAEAPAAEAPAAEEAPAEEASAAASEQAATE